MLYIPKAILLLIFWVMIACLIVDAAKDYPDNIPPRTSAPQAL